MLKKYFIEAIVWVITVTVILSSVVITFTMRQMKLSAENQIKAGWTMGLTGRFQEIGGYKFTIGYCEVREDVRESFGPIDSRIPRDGRYFLLVDKIAEG